jgi:hypothetical protein
MVVLFVVLPLLFLGIGSPAIRFIIPTLIAVSVWCARWLSRESREAVCAGKPEAFRTAGGRAALGCYLSGALTQPSGRCPAPASKSVLVS